MAQKEIKNMGESVRNRLLNISKASKRNFNAVLLQYAQERFLYRLSESKYNGKFVLKGGLLFLAYKMPSQRPTKDIDFLGLAVKNDKTNIQEIFKKVVSIEFNDGVSFNSEGLTVKAIKEDAEYEGLRLNIPANISGAKLSLQIDVGFGDAMVSKPVKKEFPGLLGMPSAKLFMYRPETVVAEKFEAMVTLGLLNSRMKDFYDISFLAQVWDFKPRDLRQSILKTFKARGVDLNESEKIFLPEYAANNAMQSKWSHFERRMNIKSLSNFKDTMEKVKLFLEPIVQKDLMGKTWDKEKWKWVV